MYRFEQMKFWRKIGNREKEWFLGGKFFIEKRRNIQRLLEGGSEFKSAYNKTIEENNLNWEYYFRSLNSLLAWIEQSSIPELDKIRYKSLLKDSLTNDEKFFLNYLSELDYNWGIKFLLKNSEELTIDLNFDYE